MNQIKPFQASVVIEKTLQQSDGYRFFEKCIFILKTISFVLPETFFLYLYIVCLSLRKTKTTHFESFCLGNVFVYAV